MATVKLATGRLSSNISPQLIERFEYLKQKPKVLVFGGPTGSNKSILINYSLGPLIEQQLNKKIEIITADSIQVKRDINAGSSRTPVEDQKYPHHLLEHFSPDPKNKVEQISSVHFAREAKKISSEIISRGNIPVIVGGSGFYLRTFLQLCSTSPDDNPPPSGEVSKRIFDEIQALSAQKRWRILNEQDPEAAKNIKPGDVYRIARALEVIELTGRPFSSFKPSKPKYEENEDFDIRCFFYNVDRVALYRNLDRRCEAMIQSGLFSESFEFLKKGYTMRDALVLGIGYQLAMEFLVRNSQVDSLSVLEFVEKYQIQTRNYSRKQFAWFRADPSFLWVDESPMIHKNILRCFQVPPIEFFQLLQENQRDSLGLDPSFLKRYRSQSVIYKPKSPQLQSLIDEITRLRNQISL